MIYTMRFIDKLKYGAIAIISAFGTMGLSALATMNSTSVYEDIKKPFFAPGGSIFPFVWGIIFFLMAVSVYIILSGGAPNRKMALGIYFAHLPVNFLWGIIFFRIQNFMFAFLWILLLLALIIYMVKEFYKANKLAAYLQIPYVLWVMFATVLNLSIWILNR